MYKPHFSITNNILKYVAAIDTAKGIIDNSPLIPLWERNFQEDAVLRQVHHSTAIEENALNYTEVKRVLNGETIIASRKRDIKEIINYRKAIELLDTKTSKLEVDYILLLNKVLLTDILPEEKIGKLRDTNVYLISSRSNEIVMEPPEADEVPEALKDLVDWYNLSDDIHPILKAGILQYEITSIHPFIEGNGRTARLLSTWSLYTSGYQINRFFSLEEYYDKDTKSYYAALASADESNDLTIWLEYFTKGLVIEFERIKHKVESLSYDGLKKKFIGQIALTERQIKIINFIQERGILQNKDFIDLFPNISDDTVLRDLKDLMDKKIIKKVGKTKGTKYFLV